MLQFFYDSLDTLKKVKKPTRKEVRMFTLQVFVAILLGVAIFFALDTFWGNLYQQVYQNIASPTALINPTASDEQAPITIPSVASSGAEEDMQNIVIPTSGDLPTN